jgi:hypothetical protein
MTTSQGLLLVMADIDPAIERDFNNGTSRNISPSAWPFPDFSGRGASRQSRARQNICRFTISNRPRFSIPRLIGMWSEREVGLDPVHGTTVQKFHAQRL